MLNLVPRARGVATLACDSSSSESENKSGLGTLSREGLALKGEPNLKGEPTEL